MAIPQAYKNLLDFSKELKQQLNTINKKWEERADELEQRVKKIPYNDAIGRLRSLNSTLMNAASSFLSNSKIDTDKKREIYTQSVAEDIFEDFIEVTPKVLGFIFGGIQGFFSGLDALMDGMSSSTGKKVNRNLSRGDKVFAELMKGINTAEEQLQKFTDSLNKKVLPKLNNIPFELVMLPEIRRSINQSLETKYAVNILKNNPILQEMVYSAGAKMFAKHTTRALEVVTEARAHIARLTALKGKLVSEGFHSVETGQAAFGSLKDKMEDVVAAATILQGPLLRRGRLNEGQKQKIVDTANELTSAIKGDEKLKNLVRGMEFSVSSLDDIKDSLGVLSRSIAGAREAGNGMVVNDAVRGNAAKELYEVVDDIKESGRNMRKMLKEMSETDGDAFFNNVPAIRPILENVMALKFSAERLELSDDGAEFSPSPEFKTVFQDFLSGLDDSFSAVGEGVVADIKKLDGYLKRAVYRKNRGGEVVSQNFDAVANTLQQRFDSLEQSLNTNLQHTANMFANVEFPVNTVKQFTDFKRTLGPAGDELVQEFRAVGKALEAKYKPMFDTLGKAAKGFFADIKQTLPSSEDVKQLGRPSSEAYVKPNTSVSEEDRVTDPDILAKLTAAAEAVYSLEQQHQDIGKDVVTESTKEKTNVSKMRVRIIKPINKLMKEMDSIIERLEKAFSKSPGRKNVGPNPAYKG